MNKSQNSVKTERCCIPYCTSPPSMLHPLPIATATNEREGRKIWFRQYNYAKNSFCSRHPLFLNKNASHDKICPLHYENNDLEVAVKETHMRGLIGSIPTIFPWSPQWIKLDPVQERHSVPASHFELLQKDFGEELHFCFMCEFRTLDLHDWDAHMKVHFPAKKKNQKKRQAPTDDTLDNPGTHEATVELAPRKKKKRGDNPVNSINKDQVRNPDDCSIIVVAEKANGSDELKDQPASTVGPTGGQQQQSSTESILSLQDKETQFLKEEAELRRQWDQLTQSMASCDKAMEQVRLDHMERRKTVRQEVERLEGEEGECQGTLADLTAKKEAMKQRSEDLSAKKQKAELAIKLMMEGDPLSLDLVNADIPEEFKPALERFRAGSSALEKELGDIRQKEEQLDASLTGSQATLSAAKQLLSVSRKEFNEVMKTMEPSFRDQMEQLAEGQRNRISARHELEKQLADLTCKRRLVQVEMNCAMNPYLQ